MYYINIFSLNIYEICSKALQNEQNLIEKELNFNEKDLWNILNSGYTNEKLKNDKAIVIIGLSRRLDLIESLEEISKDFITNFSILNMLFYINIRN